MDNLLSNKTHMSTIFGKPPYIYYHSTFSMTHYKKIVIKRHIDIPLCEEKGKTVILTEEPKYHKEYKNYPYFLTSNPYNNTFSDISYGYCVGYIVETIPYGNGCSGKFMPVYTHKSGDERILMNVEFKEKYKKYLKNFEQKKMWTILITLLCAKIPAKINFCGELVKTNISIPIEIAHIIYQFVKHE